MIPVDLSKQEALDADAIQQISFTANLHRAGNTMFFIIKKTNYSAFFTRNCESIVN